MSLSRVSSVQNSVVPVVLIDTLFSDKHLTTDFRQYAIVQQSLLTGNLKYLKTYTIPCANVYKGADLPSEQYVMGQASSADFAAYAQQLQTGCST